MIATRSGRALLCALGVASIAGRVHAQPERPSDVPIPSCLDQSIVDELGQRLRPRGVQKRPFTKQGRLELVMRGGLFAGDLMSSSYAGGGGLVLWLSEDLGVEITADVTRIDLDVDKPLAEFFGDDRFEGGLGVLGLAGLAWSPIHAKLKIGDSILHSDLTFVGGAGRMFHDSVQGIAFDAGAALEMYTTSWFTLRFDVRDVVLVQEAVAETRLTNNIMATFGIALWIPTFL